MLEKHRKIFTAENLKKGKGKVKPVQTYSWTTLLQLYKIRNKATLETITRFQLEKLPGKEFFFLRTTK